MVNAVYTSSSFTSIAWTILSVEPGRGLQAASTPPFADAAPPRRAYNQISAGGPQIKVGASRPVWRARLVTTKLAGLGALECLCTDLRFGAALRQTGQQMRVITNLRPVPAGTSKLTSCFPAWRPSPTSPLHPRQTQPSGRLGPPYARQVSGPIGRISHIQAGNRGTGRRRCRGLTSYANLPGNGGRDCPLAARGVAVRRRQLADQLDHFGDGLGDPRRTVGEPFHVLLLG